MLALWIALLFLFSGLAGAGDQYAGDESCRACHEELFAHYQRNVHATAVGRVGSTTVRGCESCHGPAARHVADPSQAGDLISFKNGEVAPCLACHQESLRLRRFATSSHGQGDLACTSCHLSPHQAAPVSLVTSRSFRRSTMPTLGRHLKSAEEDLCLSCHPQLAGSVRLPYHHPVEEGATRCSSCHNPHDPELASHSVRELCLRCHEDKAGPWAFEHAPVVEGCTSCHEPHGSVAPRLLRTGEPFVCLSCHVVPEDRHGEEVGGTRFAPAFYQKCTACHGAIHGSHGDPHLKK
ncbi:MAG: hypothetical protein NZ869_08460 [Thermoanaerobaculum sp.]|nr:hypothetical protein [Thermoanaerobaculum sp.]MDW7967008.1 cytochrome c3 family protein [Thermoanaerobaculum sp.]